jgi:hypothetical protein
MMKVMVVWYLVTDSHKVMTALILVVFCFSLVGTGTIFTFTILVWIFFCNLVDMNSICWYVSVICAVQSGVIKQFSLS